MRVVERKHPVVEGRSTRHGLVEGLDVTQHRCVDDPEREGGIVSTLDQEPYLDGRVIRPVQRYLRRLLVLPHRAPRQAARILDRTDRSSFPAVKGQRRPPATGLDVVQCRIRVGPAIERLTTGNR